MLKSFWFHFFLLPFLFSLIILFTPLLSIFPLNPPLFLNAVEYCSDVINDDVYATEYGTMQDACIAKFMGEPKMFKPLIILLAIIGFLFVIPFIIYLVFQFHKSCFYLFGDKK